MNRGHAEVRTSVSQRRSPRKAGLRDPDHRFIYVAEEWDPIYIYGSSSYGNPYGKHKEPLINAFQAEDLTSFHKMVV